MKLFGKLRSADQTIQAEKDDTWEITETTLREDDPVEITEDSSEEEDTELPEDTLETALVELQHEVREKSAQINVLRETLSKLSLNMRRLTAQLAESQSTLESTQQALDVKTRECERLQSQVDDQNNEIPFQKMTLPEVNRPLPIRNLDPLLGNLRRRPWNLQTVPEGPTTEETIKNTENDDDDEDSIAEPYGHILDQFEEPLDQVHHSSRFTSRRRRFRKSEATGQVLCESQKPISEIVQQLEARVTENEEVARRESFHSSSQRDDASVVGVQDDSVVVEAPVQDDKADNNNDDDDTPVATSMPEPLQQDVQTVIDEAEQVLEAGDDLQIAPEYLNEDDFSVSVANSAYPDLVDDVSQALQTLVQAKSVCDSLDVSTVASTLTPEQIKSLRRTRRRPQTLVEKRRSRIQRMARREAKKADFCIEKVEC